MCGLLLFTRLGGIGDQSKRVVVKMEKTCEPRSEPWRTLTDSGVGRDGSFLKSIVHFKTGLFLALFV